MSAETNFDRAVWRATHGFLVYYACAIQHFEWLNSAGTGRNGVPQPVSGVPLPETAVPPPKVVVPPPGDAVLYFLVS